MTRMVTLTEAAEEFNVSTRTLRRWLAAGQLDGVAFRVGPRMIRFDAERLRAHLLGEPIGNAS